MSATNTTIDYIPLIIRSVLDNDITTFRKLLKESNSCVYSIITLYRLMFILNKPEMVDVMLQQFHDYSLSLTISEFNDFIENIDISRPASYVSIIVKVIKTLIEVREQINTDPIDILTNIISCIDTKFSLNKSAPILEILFKEVVSLPWSEKDINIIEKSQNI